VETNANKTSVERALCTPESISNRRTMRSAACRTAYITQHTMESTRLGSVKSSLLTSASVLLSRRKEKRQRLFWKRGYLVWEPLMKDVPL
jgi:hypothetical protein